MAAAPDLKVDWKGGRTRKVRRVEAMMEVVLVTTVFPKTQYPMSKVKELNKLTV